MKMDSGKDIEGKRNRPQIVEIVGPAGSGKTTLSKVLSRCQGIRLDNFPDVRRAASFPFFAWYGFQVLSTVTLMHPGNLKALSRREFAWLAILSGWSKVLQQQSGKSNDLIILDQGPVFLLSEMSLFGPYFLRTKRAKGLWQTWYQRWSAVLDAVIWLDAPDECLLQRIRSREKDHVVKAESDQAVFKFLKDYRRVYNRTLYALAANQADFKVLKFDTSRQESEEIADQVFTEFDLQTLTSVDQY